MAGVIYARLVSDRLRVIWTHAVMAEQGDSEQYGGCVDQAFALRQVVEKVVEKAMVA